MKARILMRIIELFIAKGNLREIRLDTDSFKLYELAKRAFRAEKLAELQCVSSDVLEIERDISEKIMAL